MKKCLVLFIAIFMIGVWCIGLAGAATEVQKETAIASGLQWLASTQQADGSWYYNSGSGTPLEDTTAATAAVLLAFTEQYYKQGNAWKPGANYSVNVTNALNYILSKGQAVTIGAQTYGNPDTNGDTFGYHFVNGTTNGRDTYVTGLVLPAISRVTAGINGYSASTIVTSGPFTGKTLGTVIQNTVDYFAWGQNDSGTARGAWRYFANSGQADNSTAQWPAMGMLFAQNAGATVPQFVKNELKLWIDYIQNSNGGSGYDSPTYLVNESKTGGLLVEMAFANYDGGLVGADRADALSYLNTYWKQTASSTWDGNFGHPYAMWSIYKGLEVTIGLNNETTITNLFTPIAGRIEDNPNHGFNWWEDYCNWLVSAQLGNGSWTGYSYWTGPMATAWNINILNATQIPPPGVPEPATMLLLGLGLMGLAGLRRKIK